MAFISVNLLYPPCGCSFDMGRAARVLSEVFPGVTIHSMDALADSYERAARILTPSNSADRVALEQFRRNCETEGPAISFSVTVDDRTASGTVKRHYADLGADTSLPNDLVNRFKALVAELLPEDCEVVYSAS